MLILEPKKGLQTISIMPRSTMVTNDVIVANLRRDGDGIEEVITPSSAIPQDNYTIVILKSDILKEDCTYSLEMTRNNELWYRDKIYVTNGDKQHRKKNKHQIGGGNLYKPYNEVDDNTYIV